MSFHIFSFAQYLVTILTLLPYCYSYELGLLRGYYGPHVNTAESFAGEMLIQQSFIYNRTELCHTFDLNLSNFVQFSVYYSIHKKHYALHKVSDIMYYCTLFLWESYT